MGYYKFIVPNGRKFRAGERSMNITFNVKEDGQLYVSAEPPSEEAELCEATGDTRQAVLLLILLTVVIGLYIATKVFTLRLDDK